MAKKVKTVKKIPTKVAKTVSRVKMHTFNVPIYPGVRNPMNASFEEEQHLIVKFETEDNAQVVKGEDILKSFMEVVAPFDGKIVRSCADRSSINFTTKLASLYVKADLNDFDTIRDIFEKTKLETNIATNMHALMGSPIFVRVAVAPGYEHFDQVVDVWVIFLRESKIPKTYWTYKYFRQVCEKVFEIKNREDITIFQRDSIPVIKNLNFSAKRLAQTFISKI